MQNIGSRKPLMLAQAGFKKDIRQLFTRAADNMRTVLVRYQDSSGNVPLDRQKQARIAVGKIASDLFTPFDNRSAYADDGVTPLADYPRLLNKWLAFAVYQAVKQQGAWMKNHTPRDIFAFLKAAKGHNKYVRKVHNKYVRKVRVDPVWIPIHQRKDEGGLTLSDRIWGVDLETQKKIDRVMIQAFADGNGALTIANKLEAVLVPSITAKRTKKPYGTDVSYNAMRLARTEIAFAFNQAALVSARANPFVEMVDIARSPNGDPTCPICPEHATLDIDGSRIRDPYPVDEADEAPFHPHCMCNTQPLVGDQQDAIDSIRADLDSGVSEDEYPMNPADTWGFTDALLGSVLMFYLQQAFGLSENAA